MDPHHADQLTALARLDGLWNRTSLAELEDLVRNDRLRQYGEERGPTPEEMEREHELVRARLETWTDGSQGGPGITGY